MNSDPLDSNPSSDLLENIISASENASFHLVEDVYDNFNNKLLGKGYRITPKIREKLLNRILKKPIETSIASDNSITTNDLTNTALEVAIQNPILRNLKFDYETEANELRYLNLNPLATLLLTVIRDTKPKNLRHILFVTLISRSIGQEMQLDAYDMTNLTLASLLHDIGQLYAAIPEGDKLTDEHWRKVMVHPIIGSSVVREHMDYPSEVSSAILEHHERCNGEGYPRRIDANRCSKIGQILILSEAIAGILKPGKEIQNALVAFKLSNSNYPIYPLNAFNRIVSKYIFQRIESNPNFTRDILNTTLDTLREIQLSISEFVKNTKDNKFVEIANNLKSRLIKLQQSLYASGITHYLDEEIWNESANNQNIRLELEVTINEVAWQIQDMARDASLRTVALNAIPPSNFVELTARLNNTASNILELMS